MTIKLVSLYADSAHEKREGRERERERERKEKKRKREKNLPDAFMISVLLKSCKMMINSVY